MSNVEMRVFRGKVWINADELSKYLWKQIATMENSTLKFGLKSIANTIDDNSDILKDYL